uniref:Cuticle protein 7 n=1 Tax=Homalodisca liturata TaxID=320908 RepID=A0A1B6H7R7_9HEMI
MRMAPGIGLMALAILSMTGVSGTPGILTYYQTFPTRNENNEVVYEYRYSVDDQRSGVVNDQWEQRIGQFVKGRYSLLEPSGKVRTVSYEVDGSRGFVAVVKTSYPATSLLSNQQLYSSNQRYPEPAINLRRVVPPPLQDQGSPHNYHALGAQSYRPSQPVTRPQPPQQGFQTGFQGGGYAGPLSPPQTSRPRYSAYRL